MTPAAANHQNSSTPGPLPPCLGPSFHGITSASRITLERICWPGGRAPEERAARAECCGFLRGIRRPRDARMILVGQRLDSTFNLRMCVPALSGTLPLQLAEHLDLSLEALPLNVDLHSGGQFGR